MPADTTLSADQRFPGLSALASRLLFFSLLTNGMGQSFLFAVWPPLGREIGFSDIQVGLVITATGIVFMLGAPVWGQISEVWGRRPSIVTGQIIFGLTTALFAMVVSGRQEGMFAVGATFAMLVLLRAGFAAGASAIFPSVQAYIADVSPPELRARNLSIIGASFGLGMVAGPAAATALAEVSILAPFYGIAVVALVMAVLVRQFLPVPPRVDHRTASGGPPLSVPLLRLTPYFVMATLSMTSLALVQQVTGFRVQDLFGLSPQEAASQAGVALIVMAVALIVVQIGIVRRFRGSPLILLRVGAPAMGLAFAGMALTESYAALIACMGLFGAGIGLTIPGFVASASVDAGPAQQGRVAGLLGSFQALGFVIGPVSGASLYQALPVAPYLMGAAVAAIIALLGWTKRLERRL
ncbi:MAG: MFS transporter [Azospirillaceae bacterium]